MMTTDARVRLGGLHFDALSEYDVVRKVMHRLGRDMGGYLVTPNLSMARLARDPAAKKLIDNADLVVCDGMPLLLASRLMGVPLPQRVTGSSLIWSLSHAAAAEGYSVFLLGGLQGAPHRAGERLAAASPGLRVVGSLCPPVGFERDAVCMQDLIDTLVAVNPRIVYMGLGFPKQEMITMQLRPFLPKSWFICCGAAINFAAGSQQRAPKWMQALGLEWCHRLLKEPRRLGPRYAADAVFALGLLAKVLTDRRWMRNNDYSVTGQSGPPGQIGTSAAKGR